MSFLSGLFGFLEDLGLIILVVAGAWFIGKKCLKGGVALIIAIIVAAILSSFFGHFAEPKHKSHETPAGICKSALALRDATRAAFTDPTDENVDRYLNLQKDLLQNVKQFPDSLDCVSNDEGADQDK